MARPCSGTRVPCGSKAPDRTSGMGPYRSGRWLKVKNPDAPAARRLSKRHGEVKGKSPKSRTSGPPIDNREHAPERHSPAFRRVLVLPPSGRVQRRQHPEGRIIFCTPLHAASDLQRVEQGGVPDRSPAAAGPGIWAQSGSSQGWRTFLRNHADGITAMDLFVVPTISFRLLYGLLILRHGRRRILWMGVTAPPDRRVDRPTDR
jgi:hypothetical protein